MQLAEAFEPAVRSGRSEISFASPSIHRISRSPSPGGSYAGGPLPGQSILARRMTEPQWKEPHQRNCSLLQGTCRDPHGSCCQRRACLSAWLPRLPRTRCRLLKANVTIPPRCIPATNEGASCGDLGSACGDWYGRGFGRAGLHLRSNSPSFSLDLCKNQGGATCWTRL